MQIHVHVYNMKFEIKQINVLLLAKQSSKITCCTEVVLDADKKIEYRYCHLARWLIAYNQVCYLCTYTIDHANVKLINNM